MAELNPNPSQPPGPPDDYSARQLEKLERRLAGGKRRFVLLRGVLWPVFVVLVMSAVLWLMGNPHWHLLLKWVVAYVALGLGGALYAWKALPKRIAAIRSGRSVRVPRDIKEAFFIFNAGFLIQLAPLLFVLHEKESETVRAFALMMLISGTVLACWGVVNHIRAVRRTPREQRHPTANWLATFGLLLCLVLGTGAGCLGLFSDQVADWLLHPNRREVEEVLREAAKVRRGAEEATKKAEQLLKEIKEKQAREKR
ncbi:MAG: hypothetical protein NTW87_20435 [Planctomycetota bacterium]|nr:hypothetical protein [Planctomycetota bacterium]